MDTETDVDISEKSFEALLKNRGAELNSYLQEIDLHLKIDETSAIAHCHFIKLNANGHVRFNDFARFLANKIIDFAIPQSQILQANKYFQETGSTSKFAELRNIAANLFTALKKSGEGGEILLYILLEEILKVPQVLCKMSLKTSPSMPVHGCDGIHATYDGTSDILSLFWGESKLYKDIGGALTDCFDSLKNFLLDCGGSDAAQERDLQLLKSYIDLKDQNLINAIVQFLDKDNEKFNRVKYKGACLIGFNYEKYPDKPNPKYLTNHLLDELKKDYTKWLTITKDRIKKIDALDTFELHIFYMPFKSVQDFRDAFFNELGIKRKYDSAE